MGRHKKFTFAKSRRFSVGFSTFREAFLKRFNEELQYHEGPTRADLEGIYHEYVESNLTLNEFFDKEARRFEIGKKKTG